MENKLSDPVITGALAINEGGFVNTEFGANYNNITLKSKIENSQLMIDEFSASAGNGKLSLGGSVNLNSPDSLKIKDFDLNLKANDFQALKSAGAELNFNSDISSSGSAGNSSIKGNIKVNSSKVNVDFFEGILSKKKNDPNPPLLIEALKDTITVKDVSDTSKTKPWFSGMSLYKNMKGEVTLDLPGNTWVTGKDMNFELEGTLHAVKTTGDVSLFGDLSVKRGFYKVYGRSFDFNRGKITFTGSSELNPELDFEIVYSFRDIDKQLKQLKLTISGRMRDPTYQFMLGDQVLEEKDAISYIVFGKSINQLGEGEKEKMSSQDVAMGAAVSQLSSVVKGMLKQSAGLDVFEITGGENWKSGDVTIGKYVTKNLYLSYERAFDLNKQTKTQNTEKITLEYQLLRNLLLKATNQDINSGFDLIFKKTWK
jgi:autotransporter translocation and assembly factor TamB